MSQVPQQTVVIQSTPSTSGLAIAGLIFSILGWFTCGLLCLPGAFLSFLGLFSRGPKGAAIAGLIVGFPGSLFFMFIGFGLIMAFMGLGVAATSAVAEAERAIAEAQQQQEELRDQADETMLPFPSLTGELAEAPDDSTGVTDLGNAAVDGFDDYRVSSEQVGDMTACQVTFLSLPPTADIAAQVVRQATEQVVQANASREVLTMAFSADGEALPETHYGGALSFQPSDAQIKTVQARNGLQVTEADQGLYLVRVEEANSAEETAPVKKWQRVFIVFLLDPPVGEVKVAAMSEIEKLKSRGLDATVKIYTGDKTNKITWQQMQGPAGELMVIEYVAATDEITPNWDWAPAQVPDDQPGYASRNWTDKTGQFAVAAVFVSSGAGKVTIKRDDNGKELTIPLDRLSAADQAFVKSLQK